MVVNVLEISNECIETNKELMIPVTLNSNHIVYLHNNSTFLYVSAESYQLHSVLFCSVHSNFIEKIHSM